MLTNHEMENEVRPRNATVLFEGGSTYKPQADVVQWSVYLKEVIMVELTMPWGENRRIQVKYQDLANTCKESGWKTSVLPVEVSCIAFPSQSLWRMLGVVCMNARARRKKRTRPV